MERSGSNPNGVSYFSPGLARGTSAYPGSGSSVISTPTGLRPVFPKTHLRRDATPLGLGCGETETQGSLATLGNPGLKYETPLGFRAAALHFGKEKFLFENGIKPAGRSARHHNANASTRAAHTGKRLGEQRTLPALLLLQLLRLRAAMATATAAPRPRPHGIPCPTDKKEHRSRDNQSHND
jgi:hypothetical protein